MALLFPDKSGFTPRVGGGSAFYVKASGGLYDTGRNRSLLERPSQSEVGNLLLLQGRSARDRAEAPEVDGLDDQCCPPERDSGFVAHARHFGSSSIHLGCRRRGDWHPASHRCRGHYSCVLVVRLVVFTHGMRAFLQGTGAQTTGQPAGRRQKTIAVPRGGKPGFLDVFCGSDRVTTDSGSAYVSHAVFGVPPNTSRLGFSRKAAHPKVNSCEGTAKRWVARRAPRRPGGQNNSRLAR
jgi:hypothetical protein